MADPVIMVHSDRTEATNAITADSTWRTLDLSPDLIHEDPKIVILEVVNEHTSGSMACMMRPTGVALTTNRSLDDECSQTFALYLDGSNTVQYNFGNTGIPHVYLHAEFGGDYVNKMDFSQPARNNNIWGNTDITADVGGDAGNVEFCIMQMTAGNGSAGVGIRADGDTDNFRPTSDPLSVWGIVEVRTGDIFETYVSRTGGKSPVNTSWMYKVGYILSGSGLIYNDIPTDEAIATIGSWTSYGVGKDASTETIAICRLQNINPTVEESGTIRSIGSSNPLIKIQERCRVNIPLVLNGSEQLEYYIQSANINLWVEATFQLATVDPVLTLDTGDLTIDSGTLTVEQNTS